eukprot:4127053-Prymnesium_polylepis.1
MVDDGQDSGVPWGCELELATAFEQACAAQMSIPVCQLLIQGGPGALWCAVRTATAGVPIVCLAESGGAASAIYWYFEGGAALVEENVPKFLSHDPKVRKSARSRPAPHAHRTALPPHVPHARPNVRPCIRP